MPADQAFTAAPGRKPVARPFERCGVRLRPLAEDDLPMTLAWRNRDEARRWFIDPGIIAPEAHRAWFQRYRAEPTDLIFIVEDPATGAAVGQAAVYRIDDRAAEAEVGRFLVAPEHAGKGYMKRACAALCELSREALGLRRLYLEVLEDNHRARGLYGACGFVACGERDGLLIMERRLKRP